jgi:hypothetical protein
LRFLKRAVVLSKLLILASFSPLSVQREGGFFIFNLSGKCDGLIAVEDLAVAR